MYTWRLFFNLFYTLLGSVYLRVIFNLFYTLLGSVYLRVPFNLFYTLLGSVYLRVIFNLFYTPLGSVYLWVFLNLFYTLLGSVYLWVIFNLFYAPWVVYTWELFLCSSLPSLHGSHDIHIRRCGFAYNKLKCTNVVLEKREALLLHCYSQFGKSVVFNYQE